jgi:peptide/nickel transport system permease protein
MLVAVVLFGVFGRIFWNTGLAKAITGPPELPPMWLHGGTSAHPLGTEGLGRDMLALLILGAPSSLALGFIAAAFGLVVAIVLGFTAGFLGGWVDDVIRSLADAFVTLPAFAVLIVLAAYVQNLSYLTMATLIALLAWPWPTRTIRSQVLSMRERAYVRTARLSAQSTLNIMLKEMMPNLLPYLASTFLAGVSVAILASTSLEALGLGPARVPSLGITIYNALQGAAVLRGLWWWWAPPVFVLMFIFIALYLIAVGLDEFTNPRLHRPTTLGVLEARHVSDTKGTSPSADKAASADDAVLGVNQLHIHYVSASGTVRAVNGIDLRVGRGEAVGIVGESGCGKSTTAMAILGLIPPPGRIVSGELLLNGRNIATLDERALRAIRWKQVSLVPQGAMNSLNPVMRVGNQIEEVLQTHQAKTGKRATRARIEELLQLVDLAPRVAAKYPHELSGGMKQRISIAMAVALSPVLIVADEPTSALDVVVQRRVAQTLLLVKERVNASILVVGHDVALLAQLVDRIAVMRRGNIVEIADTRTLLREPVHPYTRLLVASVPSFKDRTSGAVALDKLRQLVTSDGSNGATASLNGAPLREVAPGHFVATQDD